MQIRVTPPHAVKSLALRRFYVEALRGRGAVDKGWVDCDRATVKRRYDRLAKFIPLFDRLLFLPPGLRRSAVEHLRLHAGERALEIGCGTGIALAYLSDTVGPGGRVHGVDLSPGMLQRARTRCASERRRNVALYECDVATLSLPSRSTACCSACPKTPCRSTGPYCAARGRRCGRAVGLLSWMRGCPPGVPPNGCCRSVYG